METSLDIQAAINAREEFRIIYPGELIANRSNDFIALFHKWMDIFYPPEDKKEKK